MYVQSSKYGSIWSLLPYYTDRNISLQYEIREGKLILKRDQNGKPATQSYISQVRLVIIESQGFGTINRMVPADYKDYDVVKAYYNVQEYNLED